jgi:hypothetical protein
VDGGCSDANDNGNCDDQSNANCTAELFSNCHWRLTLARLASGKVLDAGNEFRLQVSKAAAVYDPSTNEWTATGSMYVARGRYTLTRLLNGQVLAAGPTAKPPPTAQSSYAVSSSRSCPLVTSTLGSELIRELFTCVEQLCTKTRPYSGHDDFK